VFIMANRKILLIVIAAAVALAFLAAWPRLGTADLGEVDFTTLTRRDTPNDALACSPQLCATPADIAAPVFALPQEEVLRAVQEAVAGEPRLEQVAADAASGTLRYVQRSRLMGFPDTINVKVMPAPDGGSVVLLYSRSKLGRSDMGVNRARVERWIGLIEAATK
jgi:uncharacterized protein (DUF1499 family)